jgi:glycerophosphoryl diester phosphodiesterase
MHPPIPAMPSLRPAGRRAARDILRIAHRGGSGGAEDYRPENLRRIARLGAHLVEIDLRTTKDGYWVAYHDPTVRIEGDRRRVSDHTMAEWRRLLPADRLPSVATVSSSVCHAGLGLYLDVKDATRTQAAHLVDILMEGRMTARTILASADPQIVAAFSQVSNAIPRAVLFRGLAEDPVRLANLARADFVHPCWEDEEHPDRLLSQAWLDTVRANGLGIVSWHEERPDVLVALRELGIDGICTDAPGLLADVLGRPSGYVLPAKEP